ncbi:MAG TPA: DUF2116 family Zn-ribbon domain-containing protein [Phnomibacter sp.]|nr:DUF2116 family Zn-ribbon domain-containing protein [Phnomibacter sp.]
METSNRLCINCSKPLKGRSDKKFCDDYCRSQYNNNLQAENSTVVKHINQILKKNRKLLQDIIAPGEEMGKCPRRKLADAGFSFQYYTHLYTSKKGSTYTFVYEYGYLALEGDWLLVVKRKEENI